MGRAALGRMQRPLRMLTSVVLRTGIHVFLAVAQHGIDEPSQQVPRFPRRPVTRMHPF